MELRLIIFKGEYGEWLARKYLRKKGYLLIAENWRSKRNHRLEIDLIFRDQEMLVFVEVRARSLKSFVSGYESINRKRISLNHAFRPTFAKNQTFQTTTDLMWLR